MKPGDKLYIDYDKKPLKTIKEIKDNTIITNYGDLNKSLIEYAIKIGHVILLEV